MVLLLRKLYLYFTKDPEGVHYFSGGEGVSNFFQGGGGGVQMLNILETRVRTGYFPEGGCPDPLSTSGSAHHMGNVIITGQYLSQSLCQALICQD